jgi:C1A family cysteine protease
MPTKRYSLGWIRDLPDHRDLIYSAPLQHLRALPSHVDLRKQFHVRPYDQGRIGSCTANAIAGAIQFDREHAKQKPDFVPSRLFIYYYERLTERSVPIDSGAQIRDGIKVVAKRGVCAETTWPYDDTPADTETNLFPHTSRAIKPPSAEAQHDAEKYKTISYSRVTQSLTQLKGCLADGFPIVFGFSVFDSLYDSQGQPQAVLPLPSGKDAPIGGHAVLAVGYDDGKSLFTIRNSWGTSAQDHGYFYMPYAYLTDPHLASDFWTIRAIGL